MNRSQALFALCLSALVLCGSACSGNDGDGNQAFVVRVSQGAVDTTLRIEVRGNWVVYFEDESPMAPAISPGSLNGDADTMDSVAVAVSITGGSVFPLGVAARAAHIVGDEIYLEVVEADDDFDWNGDGGKDDLVLVHWSSDTAGVANGMGMCKASGACYVDDLDPAVVAPSLAAISHEGLLYYSSNIASGMLASGATSLNMLDPTAPLTPMAVTHTDTGPRRPRIVASDPDGLLILAYDETVEMLQLNAGDTDMLDTAVLALLDGLNPGRGIKNVGLAIPLRMSLVPPAYSPVRARLVDAGNDWLVGFFVSENDEGGMNLNDSTSAPFVGTAWNPTQCTTPDTDATDSVMHFLYFEAWFANSGTNPPRNTGLVGRDPAGIEPDRLAVIEGFVAVVSDEASAECNLNSDVDAGFGTDGVVRLTAAPTDPMADILPPGLATELHALAVGLPGPSEGLASVEDRFVIVASEMMDDNDIDMDSLKTQNLVGWIDPSSTTLTTWTFMHSGDFVGAAWMNDEPEFDRIAIAFQESVIGSSLNSACKSLSFADADTTDELPTFARFGGGSTMLFPGVGLAMSPGNGGILVDVSSAYFRVSEAAQGADINGDGDSTDFVLVRNSLFACDPVLMATTTNPVNGDDLVITDRTLGAAFVGSETGSGLDLNNNLNVGEDVLMYFELP